MQKQVGCEGLSCTCVSLAKNHETLAGGASHALITAWMLDKINTFSKEKMPLLCFFHTELCPTILAEVGH